MSAVTKFNELVEARTARGLTRQKAVLAVSRKYPELHCAYLVETNRGRNVEPALLAAVGSGSRKLFADVPRVDPAAAVAKANQVKAVKVVQTSAPAIAPASQPVAVSPPRQNAAELDPWVGHDDFGMAHGFYC